MRRDRQLIHPASWSEPILTTIGANVKGGLPLSRCLSPDGAVGYRHFSTEAIGNDGADDWAAGGERDVGLMFDGEGATETAAEWIHLGVVVDSTFRVGARISAHTAHTVLLPSTVRVP